MNPARTTRGDAEPRRSPGYPGDYTVGSRPVEGRRGQRAGSRIWRKRRYLGGCVGRFVIHGFILEGAGFRSIGDVPQSPLAPR